MNRKEYTKGRDFHGKSLKRSFAPPPPPTQSRIYMTYEGRDSRVRIKERSHALSPLPCHSETHIQTHIQRAKGEHTTGEYTGAQASRHTHPRPRGSVATQAQFIRMERRHIMHSSQHPPTPKRGVGNIICRAHPFG